MFWAPPKFFSLNFHPWDFKFHTLGLFSLPNWILRDFLTKEETDQNNRLKFKLCENLIKLSFCIKSAGIWNIFCIQKLCMILLDVGFVYDFSIPKSILFMFQSNLLSKSIFKNYTLKLYCHLHTKACLPSSVIRLNKHVFHSNRTTNCGPNFNS